MQVLSGISADVSFPNPITSSGLPYTSPMTWMINDASGVMTVDPVSGASNSAVSAVVDPVNPQLLHLTKVAEGIPFNIIAQYDGSADSCSIVQSVRDLQWAAPMVFVPQMCVAVTA